jgi:hypothetical protein
MSTQVKILDESNGVTRVTVLSGVRQGDDMFIFRAGIGNPGEIVEVPEFSLEDFESDSAKAYYA